MSDQNKHPVGYCSPPLHSRFQKGQSGNPNGRPKRPETPYTVLQKVLKRKVAVKGENRKIRIDEALIRRLRDLALSGDRRAITLHRKIREMSGAGDTDQYPQVDLFAAKLKLARMAGIDLDGLAEEGPND